MSPTRKRLWLAAQAAAAVIIIVAVARHFDKSLGHDDLQNLNLSERWYLLPPAGLLYVLAHSTFGTFWWMLLRQSGVKVRWGPAVRAYFVSQFGKYVPGKAWVLVMRVGLLRGVPGANPLVVGLTGTYETLITMASGAVIATLLIADSGLLNPDATGEPGVLLSETNRRWLLAGIALLPLGLFGLVRLLNRIMRWRKGPDAQAVTNSPLWLLVLGLFQASFAWCLMALSLRLVSIVVLADAPAFTPDRFRADLATATTAYVGGFLVLIAPGGLGPREFLFAECLRRQSVEAGSAVVIALVLRLIWSLFEVIVATGWFLLGRPRRETPVP